MTNSGFTDQDEDFEELEREERAKRKREWDLAQTIESIEVIEPPGKATGKTYEEVYDSNGRNRCLDADD